MMDKSIANASEIAYAQRKVRIAERNVKHAEHAFASAKKRLRSALKPEAIKRMDRLGINPNVIGDFCENGRVVLYYADFDMFLYPGSEEKAIIRKLEHDFDAMVYFIIRQTDNFATGDDSVTESFLYVSPDIDQLESESSIIYRPNCVYGCTYYYDPSFTLEEYCNIPFQQTPSGGLRRLTQREQDELDNNMSKSG